MLKFGLVKYKTEAYLLCVNTLIIISLIFVNFHWIFLLGSSFFGAWADFHWNYERSFGLILTHLKLFWGQTGKNILWEEILASPLWRRHCKQSQTHRIVCGTRPLLCSFTGCPKWKQSSLVENKQRVSFLPQRPYSSPHKSINIVCTVCILHFSCFYPLLLVHSISLSVLHHACLLPL